MQVVFIASTSRPRFLQSAAVLSATRIVSAVAPASRKPRRKRRSTRRERKRPTALSSASLLLALLSPRRFFTLRGEGEGGRAFLAEIITIMPLSTKTRVVWRSPPIIIIICVCPAHISPLSMITFCSVRLQCDVILLILSFLRPSIN